MAKKTAPANGISFDAMLNQTVIPITDAKKKKEQLAIINLDADQTQNLKTFISKKAEMKAAEGEMRLAEAPIIQVCLDKMDTDALQNDFHSSYQVHGNDGKTSAKFISVDKFNLSQEPENIQAVRTLFGDDTFNEEVIKTPTVTLKATVFQDEALKKRLTELLGAEFGNFFETTIKYELKSGFDERMYKIAGSKDKVVKIRSMCAKNKPFFK